MSRLNKTVHIAAAGVIVEKEGKYLLVQEGSDVIPQVFQKWNFPIGRIESFEKPDMCASREAREETGLSVQIEREIKKNGNVRPYLQKDGYSVRIDPVDMFIYLFKATVISGEIKTPSDILDARWFSLEEIEQMGKEEKLVDHYILSAIADYKEIAFKRNGVTG